ncbi:MAG TPA: hypothetical protein VJ910_02890 [Desulfuromonadales bacterium]|nr:hypothetical protein [Desulfuromonadales bacterium]
MLRLMMIGIVSLPLIFTIGCSREVVGGAALGAGAAGAAYEYSNKERLEDLRQEYESDQISREEYLRRKQEIEEKSLIY